jgi:hypothetical protein
MENALLNRITPDSEFDRYVIQFTEEEQALIDEVTKERHSSYASGSQKDTNWGPSESVMRRGVAAEVAICELYSEAELDRQVCASGDDGYDLTMTLDESPCDVDVKSRSESDGDLMVRQDRSHERADAFLLTYVPKSVNVCHVIGWISKEDLICIENEAESFYDHMNWEMEISELKPVPEPDTDRPFEIRDR